MVVGKRSVEHHCTSRDPADLDLLINAIEPQSVPWISTVIGVQGPIAPPDYCNGLMLPIVGFDQIYTFSRESIISAIPRPQGITAAAFGPAAAELFDRITLERIVEEHVRGARDHGEALWLLGNVYVWAEHYLAD